MSTPAGELSEDKLILESVTRALDQDFRDREPAELFSPLLANLLTLTGSEYGYIAEVRYDEAADPYLRTWAITGISGNTETRELYQQFAVPGGGLEFRNLDTLFGWGLREGGRLVIANEIHSDPRCSGRPRGHPPLDSFAGIPVFRGPDLVGQIAVANHAGGYDTALIARLEPFRKAVGNLIDACRVDRERRAAEAQLRETTSELTALVGALPDGVLFVSGDGSVVFVNEAFATFAGMPGSGDRHIGRPATTLLAAVRSKVADPSRFDARVAELAAGGRPAVGETVRMADGQVCERDYLPVPTGAGPPGHLWLYRDVTAPVAGQQHRQRMLERERQLREAIEEQDRSLREFNELKSDFVATVSHELRAPLTSIVSFSELLADEAPDLPAEPAEFLRIIRRNADRLLVLMADLLLIARIESGTLDIHPGPLDVADLARAATDAIRPLAAGRQIAIEMHLDPDPAPLVADESRIEQVLQNLLSNAVKFTPEGGRVTVRTARQPGSWSISVRDNGPGIPEAEQDRLFQRFFRGSNIRGGGKPGTGLGLAVSQAIAGLHHGTLTADSGEGKGTCMTVQLPDPQPVTSPPAHVVGTAGR
jgi:signal transduction histidine kinase/GAF domain-containing protein